MSVRLQDHLTELEDPRTGNATLHPLLDILLIAVCGALSGADSWTEVETYGEAKEDFLHEFLELPNGIPSHDTFTRVFRHIDPDAFTHLFTQWSAAMSDHTTEAIATRVARRFDVVTTVPPGHRSTHDGQCVGA